VGAVKIEPTAGVVLLTNNPTNPAFTRRAGRCGHLARQAGLQIDAEDRTDFGVRGIGFSAAAPRASDTAAIEAL
jgi:hypothetical protein